MLLYMWQPPPLDSLDLCTPWMIPHLLSGEDRWWCLWRRNWAHVWPQRVGEGRCSPSSYWEGGLSKTSGFSMCLFPPPQFKAFPRCVPVWMHVYVESGTCCSMWASGDVHGENSEAGRSCWSAWSLICTVSICTCIRSSSTFTATQRKHVVRSVNSRTVSGALNCLCKLSPGYCCIMRRGNDQWRDSCWPVPGGDRVSLAQRSGLLLHHRVEHLWQCPPQRSMAKPSNHICHRIFLSFLWHSCVLKRVSLVDFKRSRNNQHVGCM